MKNTGKNKVKMYKAVQAVFASNGSVWNDIPALVTAHDRFLAKVVLLDQLVFEQGTGTIGVKKVKDEDRTGTAKKAHKIASALRALAAETGNTALSEQLSFPSSDLSYKSTTTTRQLLERIEVAALEHAQELAQFGIAQTEIDEFVQMRAHMSEAFESIRNAIVNRGKNTELIAGLLKEIDGILRKSLDKLVEVLKEDHPAFEVRYRKARIIVDRPGKKNNPLDPGAATMPPLLPEGPGELDL